MGRGRSREERACRWAHGLCVGQAWLDVVSSWHLFCPSLEQVGHVLVLSLSPSNEHCVLPIKAAPGGLAALSQTRERVSAKPALAAAGTTLPGVSSSLVRVWAGWDSTCSWGGTAVQHCILWRGVALDSDGIHGKVDKKRRQCGRVLLSCGSPASYICTELLWTTWTGIRSVGKLGMYKPLLSAPEQVAPFLQDGCHVPPWLWTPAITEAAHSPTSAHLRPVVWLESCP